MKKILIVFVALIGQLIGLNAPLYAQESENVRQVVQQWSDLHNQKDANRFSEVYAGTVFYYGKYLPVEKCIKDLGTFLRKDYYQEIITPIQLTFYESGTVKCSFTKQVTINGRTKEYPSYLLVENRGGYYKVTGESDLVTDQNLKVNMDLGPLRTEYVPETETEISMPESLPVWIWGSLLGLVAVGSGVFIAKRKRKSKSVKTEMPLKEDKVKPEQPVSDEKITAEDTVTNTKPPENKEENNQNSFYQSIEAEKGEAFEKYVVSKFPADCYEIIEWRSDKYHEGRYAKASMLPDLEIRYSTQQYCADFAVECKWRKEFYFDKITWAKDYQLKNYKEFERTTRRTVFVILGVGGEPADPAHLYVFPLSKIYSIDLNKKQLAPYIRKNKGDFKLKPETMSLF